jgi:hypothetical protein
MNMSLLPILMALALCAASKTGFAQSAFSLEGEFACVSGETKNAPRPAASSNNLSAYRFHKKLLQTYSGYAIEVAFSEYPLQRDHPVFRQFGNIYYDKLVEGGYSYLITAAFSSEEAARHFVSHIILPKTPEARLIVYKAGNRKLVQS